MLQDSSRGPISTDTAALLLGPAAGDQNSAAIIASPTVLLLSSAAHLQILREDHAPWGPVAPSLGKSDSIYLKLLLLTNARSFCTTDVRVCDAQQEMQCHFAPEPYGPCADPTFDQDRRRDEAWFGKVQPFPIPELPELFRYSYLIREAWDVVKANTFQQGQAIGECLWPVPPGTVAYTCAWSVCLVDGFCTDDDALNGSDLDFFREVGLFERGSCDIKVLFSDGTPLSLSAANYPSVGTLMVGKNGAQVVKKAFSYEDPNDCGNPNIIALDPKLTGTLGYVTEHILELQTVRDYLTAKEKGVLPSGALFKVGKTSSAFFVGPFMQDSLSANVPKVFSYNIRTSRKPVQRIFEAFGSSTARVNFVMTIVDVNSVKALLWDGKDPQQIIKFNDALNAYIKSNGDPSNFLNFLRATVAVFLYLDDVAVNKRLWNQVNIVKKQWGLMDNQLSARGANDLAEGWDEFIE